MRRVVLRDSSRCLLYSGEQLPKRESGAWCVARWVRIEECGLLTSGSLPPQFAGVADVAAKVVYWRVVHVTSAPPNPGLDSGRIRGSRQWRYLVVVADLCNALN